MANLVNTRAQINSAFPSLSKEFLNLRDIEQGLDQINRLRINNAKIELKAGTKPGATTLYVSRNQAPDSSDGFYGSLVLNNLGSTSTGINQTRWQFGFEDTSGHNESWGFSYQHSATKYPLYLSSASSSELFSLNITFPYGYWSFVFDTSVSTYESEIQGAATTIDTSGESRSITLNTSLVAHRDQTSTTKLSAKLAWKRTQNYILSNLVDASSRTLSISTLELLYTEQFQNGQFVFSLSYNEGLTLFNALDDSTTPIEFPRAQFESTSFLLNTYVAFPTGSLSGAYSLQISGQYSQDLLFGSEQIAYGNYSTVRGLRESVIFGNNGTLIRNELSIRTSPSSDPDIAKSFGVFETYFSLDYGQVFSQEQYQISGSHLTGATIGIRTIGGAFSIDVTYSDIIHYHENILAAVEDSGLFYVSTTITF